MTTVRVGRQDHGERVRVRVRVRVRGRGRGRVRDVGWGCGLGMWVGDEVSRGGIGWDVRTKRLMRSHGRGRICVAGACSRRVYGRVAHYLLEFA